MCNFLRLPSNDFINLDLIAKANFETEPYNRAVIVYNSGVKTTLTDEDAIALREALEHCHNSRELVNSSYNKVLRKVTQEKS